MQQDEIIRRLSAGEGFGGAVPERLDTHISVVFLAGDEAYKLKRAITTSYLDYGSLAARRRLCEAELAINRRTAPDLYLGVVPVTLTAGGGLVVGEGEGEVVDWLVRMRRFSQDDLFDRMAEDGRLTEPLLIELADGIARFHDAAGRVTDAAADRRIAFVIEENAEELRQYLRGDDDRAAIDRFDRASRAAFDVCRAVLARRGADGFIRHCHGDLHLRNICLYDGKPTLFDAIEFSETISHIDVLFDAAFLLMDLVHRGLRRQANAVFNRYLYRTGDIGDLAILPLFLALRAGIRAHTSAMAAQGAVDQARRDRSFATARDYLRLGIDLLQPAQPVLIAIGGLSGSGKSTVARDIAPFAGPPPGALILGTDPIRKQLWGVDPLVPLPPEAYRRATDDAVYDTLLAHATSALAAGRSVIADGTFRDPATRRAVEALAASAGAGFDGVWLEADAESLIRRVGGRTGDSSDATVPVLREQLATTAGDIEWRRVDAARPLAAVSRDVGRVLGIHPG